MLEKSCKELQVRDVVWTKIANCKGIFAPNLSAKAKLNLRLSLLSRSFLTHSSESDTEI